MRNVESEGIKLRPGRRAAPEFDPVAVSYRRAMRKKELANGMAR